MRKLLRSNKSEVEFTVNSHFQLTASIDATDEHISRTGIKKVAHNPANRNLFFIVRWMNYLWVLGGNFLRGHGFPCFIRFFREDFRSACWPIGVTQLFGNGRLKTSVRRPLLNSLPLPLIRVLFFTGL